MGRRRGTQRSTASGPFRRGDSTVAGCVEATKHARHSRKNAKGTGSVPRRHQPQPLKPRGVVHKCVTRRCTGLGLSLRGTEKLGCSVHPATDAPTSGISLSPSASRLLAIAAEWVMANERSGDVCAKHAMDSMICNRHRWDAHGDRPGDRPGDRE